MRHVTASVVLLAIVFVMGCTDNVSRSGSSGAHSEDERVQQTMDNCLAEADIDQNGVVDFLDIQHFIALLSS